MAEEATAPDLRPDHVRRGEPSAPAAPEAKPSSLGRYQLLFELARGGMGVVHVGRLLGAHGFDRVFAIKRPIAADAPRDEIAAFLDEARVTAKLHHPNVVETIDLGEHDGAPFLVMTFVPGVSLARLLGRLRDRGETLDPWLVAWIAREIASGLHAAHELPGEGGERLGLVHRDVSPENVLLSFEGRALVTDFGVAKWRLAARTTEAGVTRGKLAYMAPEQTRAGPLDRRADVFALGVVAYEALVGHRLFAGDSPAETIRRVLSHDPPDPRAERPEVPEDLAALVLRCLEKDPSRRPASAGEVASELRALLRRERRVVDASDVVAVVARAFPGERERLAERIERAARAADASVENAFYEGAPAPHEGPQQASASRSSVTAAALPARASGQGLRRTLALAGLGAALLVAALIVFRSRPAPSSAGPSPAEPGNPLSVSETSRPPAAPPAAAATSVSASTPTAGAPPAAAPADIAPAADPSLPSSATSRPATARPRPTGGPSAGAPPPASAPPPPSQKPPSNKGVPFRTLDP